MVYLTPKHLECVGERNTDCLCAACLKAVRVEYDLAQLTGQIAALSGNKWR
jgi:hypothetical protein